MFTYSSYFILKWNGFTSLVVGWLVKFSLWSFRPTEYWKLANKNLLPRISWSIKGNYKSYNPNSKRCSLCLHKKLEIVDDPEEILLNERSEVISQCRHRNKYKLETLVSNKKNPWVYIIIEVASCRCTGNISCEDFPNSVRY